MSSKRAVVSLGCQETALAMDSEYSIRPIDVGSFPLQANLERYMLGATQVEKSSGEVTTDEAEYFITQHNSVFRSKAEALGPENAVVTYAQCRGMIDQFLLPVFHHVLKQDGLQAEATTSFGGISRSDAQAVAAGIAVGNRPPSSEDVGFAEISALRIGVENLCTELGVDRISYKSCITGPLEMSLNLQRLAGFPRGYDERLVEYFTEVVRSFVLKSVTASDKLVLETITLDEPAFGLEGFGDFFTDTSSDTRLSHLITCWNKIYNVVPSDVYRGIHLHTSPFERIFESDWNLLEAHVGVFVNRKWLKDYDKFIRAAIVRTDGPTMGQSTDIKTAWQEIVSGSHMKYLQPAKEMEKYLRTNIELYGAERVPFAGPECGLGSWDWKNGSSMAIATLERMKETLRVFN
jgi:methionine synthase II (cobalamin-independent)